MTFRCLPQRSESVCWTRTGLPDFDMWSNCAACSEIRARACSRLRARRRQAQVGERCRACRLFVPPLPRTHWPVARRGLDVTAKSLPAPYAGNPLAKLHPLQSGVPSLNRIGYPVSSVAPVTTRSSQDLPGLGRPVGARTPHAMSYHCVLTTEFHGRENG
jgi:hypothetical protein